MSDSKDTRARILSAATTEFAARGIAGARVDRIATESGASKPMLYTYFGSKDKLFEAVFTAHVVANSDRVPFTADDLPGYAVALYDDYLADPALLRLIAWKRLEISGDAYLYGALETNDAAHRDAITGQQRAGAIRSDITPADVWSLVISAAATWAQVSITQVATTADQGDEHDRRRKALAAFIRDGLGARTRSA
jgi:AcrR family transcriptional regulator